MFNDDNYLKIWELDNLDFDIPWFYLFEPIYSHWFHYNDCKNIYYIVNNNSDWRNNLIKFEGYFDIPIGNSDFYYIPNHLAFKFFRIFEVMYNSKIFLECAVPTTMGIILSPKYQLINFRGLWGYERNNVINYLKKAFDQITIHPIKFSNELLQSEVKLYIFFINAKDY